MPVYGTAVIPQAAVPADLPFFSINNEASTVYPSGTAGERCALSQPWFFSPEQISAEVQFSANPGAFEIDIQTADTDTTNAFQTVPTAGVITSASQSSGSGPYFARAELNVKALFARAFVKTQTANGVNITVKISR